MLIVATLTFFLVQLDPGDPAAYILGSTASKQQIAQLHTQLGLDRPLLEQFGSWLGNALHGDFGDSYVSAQPVSTALAQALPATLSVALLSTGCTLVAGVLLGIWAAVRGGRVDKAVQTVCGFGMAVPNYWLAAFLVLLLAIKVRAFPATGYVDFTDSPGEWLAHLVLPVAALSAGVLAQVVFQARSATLDALSRDFVRTLQAAGIPRRRILLKHVLRNAAIPVTTVTGINFVMTLGGVVVIESIFNLSGMGNLMLTSVQGHDLTVVQGAVLFFSAAVVLANLVVDLVTAWLDPRVRTA
jgi:peptide/nickel transport system permease protein